MLLVRNDCMKHKKQKTSNSSNKRKDDQIWRSDAPDIPEHGDAKTSGTKATRSSERSQQQENQNYLTKEDLPDATNESKGKMGSGQRQDSN